MYDALQGLGLTVRKHRQLLLEVMQVHGFVNYYTEWWHFSYGDHYWAYDQSIKQAIYGSSETLIITT